MAGFNAFLKNNNIITGTAIPTEGNFKTGDIIVNVGPNSATEPMWICNEGGNPGIWGPVGVGSGSIVSINSSVLISEPTNEVSLASLGVGVSSKDKLLVHYNSTHLLEGVHFEISNDGSKIVKLGEGSWNEEGLENCIFALELFKGVQNIVGNEITVASKMTCKTNHVIIENPCGEVEIGIEGFKSENDTLMVFKNGVIMVEGVDYTIEGDIITSTGEVWNENGIEDYGMTFVVFKEVVLYEGDNGTIKMDHLAEDVKEAIENASNIDLSGYQSKEDEGLVTNNKTVIGAINELFQNANNGKELIANAIGEPLDSSDTFSAMSNDINGLLSTFKTNMMNNGITVESSDRFKQLIDKIATMVEEGNGKGIQMTSGEINSLSNNTYTTFDGLYSGYVYGSGWNICNYIELSLNFTPTIILVQSTITTSGSSPFTIYSTTTYDNFSKNGIVSKAEFTCSATVNNDGSLLHFSPKIENGKYILPVRAYNTNYPIGTIQCTWLAIGVGEEDTTLRDSLASILQEEGVNVTNEDNMASLISKVDQEFDRQVVPQGNAGPEHVLQGVSFMNSSGTVQSGNIPILASNIANDTNINSYNHYMTGEIQVGDYSGLGGNCVYFAIPQYYYTSVPWIMSYCPDLKPENIVSGKNICGVTGTATASSLGGKRITSGTGTVTANGTSYRQLIVAGLPFRPRIVFVQSQSAAIRYVSNVDFGAIYVRGDTGGAGYFSCYNTDTTDPSTLASNIRNGNSYMGPNWFGMYVVDSVGATVSWVAWE